MGEAARDHLIRFYGYIVKARRLELDLPEVVWFDKIVRVPNREALNLEINKEAAIIIIRQRGMVVTKNQELGHIQIGNDESFENRMFVPMEMIGYIDCEVKDITGETPNHEDGITFVGSGVEKKELKAN